MNPTNRQPGHAPGVPLEEPMWSEGEHTPQRLSEREDALLALS